MQDDVVTQQEFGQFAVPGGKLMPSRDIGGDLGGDPRVVSLQRGGRDEALSCSLGRGGIQRKRGGHQKIMKRREMLWGRLPKGKGESGKGTGSGVIPDIDR